MIRFVCKIFLCWKHELKTWSNWGTHEVLQSSTKSDAIWYDNELFTDDKFKDQENQRTLRDTDINVLIICVDLAVDTNCKGELKLY